MLLKIVAVVYGLWFVAAAFDPGFYDTPYHMVGSSLALGGLIALFDHAFKLHFLSPTIWRLFAVTYVADGLIHVVRGARSLIETHHFEVLAGAAAISFAFQFPMLLSLWQLSRRSSPSRLQQEATR
jgi:hypothetical protein